MNPIDERWEFLRQNIESLHSSVQANADQLHELTQRMEDSRLRLEAQEEREARLRRAMLSGIRAYLEGLNGDEGAE
jgi:prefoldin subunit 5